MPAEANNLPDSEAVPSGLREVSLILRVAHKIHPTHPRIAYLCEFCNKNIIIMITFSSIHNLEITGCCFYQVCLQHLKSRESFSPWTFKLMLWSLSLLFRIGLKPYVNQQNLFYFQFAYT